MWAKNSKKFLPTWGSYRISELRTRWRQCWGSGTVRAGSTRKAEEQHGQEVGREGQLGTLPRGDGLGQSREWCSTHGQGTHGRKSGLKWHTSPHPSLSGADYPDHEILLRTPRQDQHLLSVAMPRHDRNNTRCTQPPRSSTAKTLLENGQMRDSWYCCASHERATQVPFFRVRPPFLKTESLAFGDMLSLALDRL